MSRGIMKSTIFFCLIYPFKDFIESSPLFRQCTSRILEKFSSPRVPALSSRTKKKEKPFVVEVVATFSFHYSMINKSISPPF